MIVVTTPTGQIGGQLVPLLLDAGEPVRVIARDPSRLADAVRERVEIVQGSHGDPAVVDEAFAGADALFWLVAPDRTAASIAAGYLDFTAPACAAIARHGIGHVVDVSALGRGTRWEHDAGLASLAIRMDAMLAATGAAQRGLAMPGFMDNMLMQVEPIRRHGTISGSIDPGRRLPQVATRDIAAVAARLLVDRSWSGQADVPVLGPEDLSFDEMAAIIADVLGRPVRYRQVPTDALAARMRDHGSSESFAQAFVAMMRAKDEGLDNTAARTAEAATPTTFRQWCADVLKPAVEG